MTFPSSFNVSGLLGGTAGQIDTTSLISQLMQAQSIPQTQLETQLSTLQNQQSAYQAINSDFSSLQTAAQALTDPTAWLATTASSSTSSVVASSTGSAATGVTSFNVTQLAQAQVSTVAPDSSGNVVADPSAGITLTVGSTNTNVPLTAGDPTTVAAAINSANLGVRASVVSTDQGNVLQLVSSTSGSAAAFTASGFENSAQTLVTAQDAQITVGDPSNGGYSVSSASNTFTGFIPGVTFSVSALASNVQISVTNDSQSISDKVSSLVTAANQAMSDISATDGQAGILEGDVNLQSLASSILSAVSNGTSTGGSLSTYGITINSSGQLSFDSSAFASAYAADPAGTQSAISGSFASALNTAASAAVDPISGSLTQVISSNNSEESNLNTEITNWTTRLTQIQTDLQTKYNAMETALAGLQTQQTFLTSMINSINNSNSSSSSSSSSS